MWMPDSTDAQTLAWAIGVASVFAWPWYVWAVRNAAYGVRVDADRLRVRTWRGAEEWVLSDIRAVEPLMVRGVRSGVTLTDVSGERLRLDWTGRMRFSRILDALRSAGLTWSN